jgi:hypothetical protein
MREVSVGLYFGFRLGELTDGIDLPLDRPRAPDVIRNLESKAAYIVGLANDIYTVEKEMAKGEVNNMVLVLMHEESLDFDRRSSAPPSCTTPRPASSAPQSPPAELHAGGRRSSSAATSRS